MATKKKSAPKKKAAARKPARPAKKAAARPAAKKPSARASREREPEVVYSDLRREMRSRLLGRLLGA